MLQVREIEPADLAGWVTCHEYMNPVVWAGVYEGGELTGYGCVSRLHGSAWAHDLRHWGTEPTAVLRLYRFLTKAAKERGVSAILTDVSSEKMMRLYKAMGWTPKSVILRGEL